MKVLKRHDRRISRDRRLRIADRAQWSSSQTISDRAGLSPETSAPSQQRREIAGDENARRTLSLQFMRERAFAVERGKMHDTGAAFSAPKSSPDDPANCRGQRLRIVLARSGAQERRGRAISTIASSSA